MDLSEAGLIPEPETAFSMADPTAGRCSPSVGINRLSVNPAHGCRSSPWYHFCTSRVFSAALWNEFGSVTCVEVRDIPAFCRRVASCLPANARFPGLPGRERIGQRVEYYHPSDAPGTRWSLPDRIALSKLAEFAHQKEFRLVFSTTGALDLDNVALRLERVDAPLAPSASRHVSHDVDVGSLRDICRVHAMTPRRPILATEATSDLSVAAEHSLVA